MNSPLNILCIEDKLADFLLLERQLQNHAFTASCHRLASREELALALARQRWDVILSDYSVPKLAFSETLELLKPLLPETPLILVSGSIGEERAVELMRDGVSDFVLKDNLSRLGPVIQRNLREIADRRARQQAEAARRASEEEFRALFETASIGMALNDPTDCRFLRVNPKLCAITGYTEAELLARTVWDITYEPDQAPGRQTFQRALAEKLPSYHLEKRYVHKAGHLVWVSIHASLLRDPEGKPLRAIAAIEDITARRQAEEERHRLSTALEQASEAIVITDLAARMVYVNPAFERVTGYSRNEVLGQNPRLLQSGKHDPGFYRELWQTLTRGEVWRGHFYNKRKDGQPFEEEATITPVRNAAGEIVNYMAIKLDVTREVALQSQVRQSQKLEAIGQLAGGVAHDFNNILAAIMMQAQLAELTTDLPAKVAEDLHQIRLACERAARLTHQLLLFSRKQILQPTNLDLNQVVTQILKMLRRIIGESVTIQTQLHPQPLPTHADAGMLDQVLLNLAINARDAMNGCGTLIIRTAPFVVASGQPLPHPDARPGRYVRLAVGDTGTGIAPDVLPRIFEPFFTTKEQGKGTGLGLATVFGIVKQHHGWIEVHTELGLGSTFEVYLPATPNAVPAAPATPSFAPSLRGRETILVAEDDFSFRKILVKVLESHGYTVLEAADGPAARTLWQQHMPRIDLLLTDLLMPGGLSGRELARELRTARPELKVIYLSGYSADFVDPGQELRPDENFLQKPVAPTRLLALLRRQLDGLISSHP